MDHYPVAIDDLPPGATLVDIRTPEEMEAAPCRADLFVPMDGLIAASKGWEAEQLYVLVCRSGNRTLRAATALREAGLANVVSLNGGLLEHRDLLVP